MEIIKPLLITLALGIAFIPLCFRSVKKFRGGLVWLAVSVALFVVSIVIPFCFPVGKDLNSAFPLVPGLDEYIRLFPIHIALAWASVISFVSSFVYAVLYLKKRTKRTDRTSYNSNLLGIVFCSLATIVGAVWAKHSWGEYWNWDPRQVSVVFMLFIYFAYFLLRSSVGKTTSTAKSLAAGYSIMAGIAMPVFMFILPRTVQGLHPTSGASLLDSFPLLCSFSFSLFSVTTLLLALLNFLNIKKS